MINVYHAQESLDLLDVEGDVMSFTSSALSTSGLALSAQ
jgi:hypothetical protein